MRRSALKVVGFSILLLSFAFGWQLQRAAAQSHEALGLIGKWKLNVAESKFELGSPPKGLILTWQWDRNTLKQTAERITENGKTASSGWTAKFDSKDHLSGGGAISKISVKRIDAHTSETVETMNSGEVLRFRQVLSKDGKTLTITRKGSNAEGRQAENVQVFDRQ